jgi:hydrogenase large subunit
MTGRSSVSRSRFGYQKRYTSQDEPPQRGRPDGGRIDRHRTEHEDGSTERGGSATDGGTQERQHAAPTGEVDDAERLTVDPVTRVSGGGSGALTARLDGGSGTVEDTRVRATLFRGYETVLEGRDARDEVDLASRVCGDTGVVNALSASLAVEMAADSPPPALGVWGRNMGQAAAFLYNIAGHLFLRAGPDYSAAMVAERNPDLLARAGDTSARRADVHGYGTVGDIMAALDPLEGELYLETIDRARTVQQLISLPLGKFPHPSTVAPGGLTTTLDQPVLTQYFERLKNLADYAKVVPPLWDDLLDFMLEHRDGFADVGRAPANFLTCGAWDDPAAYDATYGRADEWGRARLSPPGVVRDGELETTDLHALDRGIEEFVDHARYADWTVDPQRFDEAPAGGAISPNHPWNKATLPRPEAAGDATYSWATARRWDRTPMESGPIARQWVAARADDLRHPLVEATADGLTLTLPEVALPESSFRWEVPDRVNAAEPLRAKAYSPVYAGIACYEALVETLDELKDGDAAIHEGLSIPDDGRSRGVGFCESGRGAVTHHVVLDDGGLDTYQILTPSTWAASPADPFDAPGPIETAVRNTPLRDGQATAATDLDLLRTVRSFDPCMVCAGH